MMQGKLIIACINEKVHWKIATTFVSLHVFCAALAQTNCVVCHSCHSHVEPMHEQSCYCWHCVRQLLVPVPKVPCKYANRSASLSNSNHVSNAECFNGSWTIWKWKRTWEHVQKWSLPPFTHSNHKPQTLFWPIRPCSRFNSIVIRYNVVSSQAVLRMFFGMNLGGRDDDLLSLNSFDHHAVGLIEATWPIAGCWSTFRRTYSKN